MVTVHSVTSTFTNPSKIRFANGICSLLNHFLTDFAVNAKSCINSSSPYCLISPRLRRIWFSTLEKIPLSIIIPIIIIASMTVIT